MDRDEEIAKVAYELYERDGKQDGKDREHWLEAERIVEARRAQRAASQSGQATASKGEKAAPKKAQEPRKQSAASTADKGKKTARTPRSK